MKKVNVVQSKDNVNVSFITNENGSETTREELIDLAYFAECGGTMISAFLFDNEELLNMLLNN